jgi:predicted nuclease of predicted toxin-antitoxin system
MRVLFDMNLPPAWVRFLQDKGFETLHWSTVGDSRASDVTIMGWARHAGYVVFTHDLGFSALLAATEATGPSVIQVRTQDVLPDAIGDDVIRVLRSHSADLEQGAIVTLDKLRSRVRVLPIRRS